MSKALKKLRASQKTSKSLISVGLEPSLDYLPANFSRNMEGCEEFLRLIIEATEGLACAYKFNFAFFEAHAWEGMELMYAIREIIPDDVFVIADAKRSDIGTSARHYAESIYDRFQADSATVNPLMGHDSAKPFLDYTDKLNFFLVLTSNPGADDFLLPQDLHHRIARKVVEWNEGENCGFVAGGTRPDQLAELRGMAPGVPFLIPGLGAQGGSPEEVVAASGAVDSPGNAVFHLTRSILPGVKEKGDPGDLIREKTLAWRDRINSALEGLS